MVTHWIDDRVEGEVRGARGLLPGPHVEKNLQIRMRSENEMAKDLMVLVIQINLILVTEVVAGLSE